MLCRLMADVVDTLSVDSGNVGINGKGFVKSQLLITFTLLLLFSPFSEFFAFFLVVVGSLELSIFGLVTFCTFPFLVVIEGRSLGAVFTFLEVLEPVLLRVDVVLFPDVPSEGRDVLHVPRVLPLGVVPSFVVLAEHVFHVLQH